MTVRSLAAAAFVALGLGAAATPAPAHTVHVMGLSFEQSDRAPAAAITADHGHVEGGHRAR